MTQERAIEDEVVSGTAEDAAEFTRVNQEVAAFIAEDKVFFVATIDGIVTRPALDHIRAGKVRDDIVTGSALDMVGAVAALDSVIAIAAPKRIVADAADDRIVADRAANRDVIATGILNNATRVAYDTINIRRQTRCVSNHQVD